MNRVLAHWFSTSFVLDLEQTGERTDERTGKTHNAAYQNVGMIAYSVASERGKRATAPPVSFGLSA